MNKAAVLGRIRDCGIVPAVRVETQEQVLTSIAALREGGIDVAEIAMSMAGAARFLDAALARFGDTILIGAGTVLDAETARICILAGARFIISPALDRRTIELCRRYDVAVLPGALTPTEILTAWTAGADCVKVFPASTLGGASYVKAVKAPLPQVELLPMGGVSLETVEGYINAGSFALGVGSDLVNIRDATEDQGSNIAVRARKYLARCASARSVCAA